ncbi:hypothetical protein G9A89_011390 [Geosiphon pyriformis]|nr:hypothetical protein G9A89_011390 [Geosiphon pyriformis]
MSLHFSVIELFLLSSFAIILVLFLNRGLLSSGRNWTLGAQFFIVKDYFGVLGNENADVFTGAIVLSNMCLPHIIDEHFLRAGGTAVSEVGSGFRVLIDSLHADVDWSKSSLVWHLDFHLAAGFTSTQTVGFQIYFMKALYHCLLVVIRKHLYNRSYPSVICLFCDNIKVSNHVFFCPFDAASCAWLVEVHASAWKTCLDLSHSSLCVLWLLSTCVFNVGIDTALCKGFVFKEWYHESVAVFKDSKIAAQNIMAFVHEFCFVFCNDVWLVHVKHWAVIEKGGLILCDGSVSVSISGLLSVLLVSVIRLLGIVDAFSKSKNSEITGDVIDLLAGLISGDILQADNIECKVFWGSEVESENVMSKNFGRHGRHMVTLQDQVHLANIYKKKQTPVLCPVLFGVKTWAQIAGGSSPHAILSVLSGDGLLLDVASLFLGSASFVNSGLSDHLSFVELVPLTASPSVSSPVASVSLASILDLNMVLDNVLVLVQIL